MAVDTGIFARLLGSHFRFSGRTQQQVKHDAMVIGRRPQPAAPRRRRPMPTRWTVPLPSSYNNHTEHNCAGQSTRGDSLDLSLESNIGVLIGSDLYLKPIQLLPTKCRVRRLRIL